MATSYIAMTISCFASLMKFPRIFRAFSRKRGPLWIAWRGICGTARRRYAGELLMAQLSVEALVERLQQGKPVPAILLLGSDAYLREAARERIVRGFRRSGGARLERGAIFRGGRRFARPRASANGAHAGCAAGGDRDRTRGRRGDGRKITRRRHRRSQPPTSTIPRRSPCLCSRPRISISV